MKIPRLSRLIIRMLDEEVPSRGRVIARKIEVEPLRNIHVFSLIISSFEDKHRMSGSGKIGCERATVGISETTS